MTPDDPRHGTIAGYSAHRRAGTPTCDDCRHAMAVYQRGLAADRHFGRTRNVSPLGFRRRIEALQALGWSLNEIARRLGVDVRVMPARMNARYVRAATSARMDAIYRDLCMTVPTDRYANRRRTLAARKGYAPPLAWDDIDDPNETPNLGGTSKRDTLAEYRFLRSLGVSHEQAARQLGITVDGIERALERERSAA